MSANKKCQNQCWVQVTGHHPEHAYSVAEWAVRILEKWFSKDAGVRMERERSIVKVFFDANMPIDVLSQKQNQLEDCLNAKFSPTKRISVSLEMNS